MTAQTLEDGSALPRKAPKHLGKIVVPQKPDRSIELDVAIGDDHGTPRGESGVGVLKVLPKEWSAPERYDLDFRVLSEHIQLLQRGILFPLAP